jgi:hypothetical protein
MSDSVSFFILPRFFVATEHPVFILDDVPQ